MNLRIGRAVFLAALALANATLFASDPEPIPLISGFQSTGGARTNYGGALGVQFQFLGLTGSKATELGIYDGGQAEGLRTNHLLSLYGISDRLAESGTLLASATISAGSKSAGAAGGYAFTNLPAPVTLTNGAFYVVVADYPATNTIDPYLNMTLNTVTSLLGGDFLSRFSDLGGFVPDHGFPNVLNIPLAGYAGPALRVTPLPAPPVFISQPQSASGYAGHSVKLAASVQGALQFQWQFAPSGDSFTNLKSRFGGTKTSTLTVSGLDNSDAGNYRLIASNAFGVSTSAVATVTVFNGAGLVGTNDVFARAVLSNSPVAYWRLNDSAEAPLIYDFAGLHDAVNENAALAVAGLRSPDYPAFSSSNTAAYFDGFSSSIASSPGLMNELENFTLMGWFNPSGPNPDPRAGLFGQDDALELGFNDTDGISLWTPNGLNWIQLVSGTNGFAWENWYFVTVTADSSGVKLYVDGVLKSQTGLTWTGSSTSKFRIGGGGIFDSSGNYFNGKIEDVALLSQALTGRQIEDLYGLARGIFAPNIIKQPSELLSVLESRTAEISIEASGSDLVFQWQRASAEGSYTNLVDSELLAGAGSATLRLFHATPSISGRYRVIISNAVSQLTSESSELVVLPEPAAGTFGAAVLARNPTAYWRLDETNDPSHETVWAYDYAGQFHATYGDGVQNGSTNGNVSGPRPESGFAKFEADNHAVKLTTGTQNSWLTVPPLNLNTSNLTICAWVKPNSTDIPDYAAVFFSRTDQTLAGLNFGGANTRNKGMLTYTWTADEYTWGTQTYIILTNTDWAFLSVVVRTNYATLFVNGVPLLLNPFDHPIERFEGISTIGTDLHQPLERIFDGRIDEVCIFNRPLSYPEIKELYESAPVTAPVLTLGTTNGVSVLSWDVQGRLESTTALEGFRTIWKTEATQSPTTITNSGLTKFYRLATP